MYSGHRILRVVGDQIALHLAFLLAFLIRFGGALPQFNFASYLGVAPWLSVALLVFGTIYDLYARERRAASERLPSLLILVLLMGITTAGLSFLTGGVSLPRLVLVLALPLLLSFSTASHALVDRLSARREPAERILVAGSAETIERVSALLVHEGVTDPGSVVPCSMESKEAVIQQITDAKPTSILVSPELPAEVKSAILEQGLLAGYRVYLLPDLYELMLFGSRRTSMGQLPLLAIRWPAEDPLYRAAKRAIDVLVSISGLILTAPLSVLLALLIWTVDGPPVLYRQQRTGAYGRPFELYKFRTMRVDAEARSGPVISSGADDPRATRLGLVLRKTRLDELPQLWNVLTGDMSLVGPRPERPFFVGQFIRAVPGYVHRLRLKPGLTGLAQVEGHYSTPVEDKLRFDLLYARSPSIWVDFSILLKTARTILMGQKSS